LEGRVNVGCSGLCLTHLVDVRGVLRFLVGAEVEVEELLEEGEESLVEGELEGLDLHFGLGFNEEGELIVYYGYTYLVVVLVLVWQVQQEPLNALSADGLLQDQLLH
jgi:hypothetical protein